MILTFIILIITIIMFVWGKLQPDIVALLSLMALFLSGVIRIDQALAGFGNTTVVMIAALFVVGEGLSRTGVTAWLSEKLLSVAGSNSLRFLIVLMTGTAALSAFISNTGTVATLMPAVVSASWGIGSIPSKFLMPLAFAANTGGLLTLTGTPPNIIVSDTLTNAGFKPFSFFEYSLIGLPMLLGAIGYMVLIGRHLLPTRRVGERPIDLESSMDALADTYSLQGDLFRLRVRKDSSLVGKTLEQAALGRDYGMNILNISRPNLADGSRRRQMMREGVERIRQRTTSIPGPETVIQANDILLIMGAENSVQQLAMRFNLAIQPMKVSRLHTEDTTDEQLKDILLSHEMGLAEVLIAPRSNYIGRTVTASQFAQKFSIRVLSISRKGKPVDRNRVKLALGDSLLVRGTWENIVQLKRESRNFVVVGSPATMARQVVELHWQAVVAVAALAGMVILMVSGLVPAVMAAVMAAVAMVLGGCLNMSQAYRAISWSSVVLIAAMIPMSTALQVTGGAEFLADGLVNTLGAMGPLVLLVGVFLFTTGFSQVMSNTATTVLVAPIVLQAALELQLSPYPYLMIVAVSASTAFLTPIGTSTNLMVMPPGGYRFNDYMKVGLPLLAIFMGLSLLLIPLIWPF